MPVVHKYTLIYFDHMSRAESMRLLFALKGVDYEDKRIAREAWPDFKPKTPFGQMPCLEVDGKVLLAQSLSIMRYLGKQHGLMAGNDLDNALCDMIADGINDFYGQQVLRDWFEEQDPEKKKELWARCEKEVMEPFIARYEGFLAKANGDYFVANTLTWADLVVFADMHFWGTKYPKLMENCPKLNAFVDRIAAIPQIKKWIEERPVTEI